MIDLTNYLAPSEIQDIRELAKNREFVSFLKLFRGLKGDAIDELVKFRDLESACRSQGKVQALNTLLDSLNSLYTNTRNVAQSTVAGVTVRSQSTGGAGDSESEYSSPAY